VLSRIAIGHTPLSWSVQEWCYPRTHCKYSRGGIVRVSDTWLLRGSGDGEMNGEMDGEMDSRRSLGMAAIGMAAVWHGHR
jgi:hypothetical protein